MNRDVVRQGGNAVMVLVLLLLLVGGALGLNYVRNVRIEKDEQPSKRPYARYAMADLELLAQGYRMELAGAEKRYGAGRVQTRTRHRFEDQIDEFERVQKAARKSRDKALDLAAMRREIAAIEAEQQRRASGDGLAVHLSRMFKL